MKEIKQNNQPIATDRTVHLVTMSKGGCGKTVVAWNMVQWLRDSGREVTVIDLDPMNHSLAEYRGLGATTVDLLEGVDQTFAGDAVDTLAEKMLQGLGDWVLDNGAVGFVPLLRYLADNDYAGLLREHGGKLVVHAVLGGGSMSAQCLLGLNTLLDGFAGTDVRFVPWINDWTDLFNVDGMGLGDMAVYRNNLDRLMNPITLKKLRADMLKDFKRLHAERLTYEEALGSPKWHLMNKQRLTIVRRDVWSQLDGLGLIEKQIEEMAAE